MKKVSFYYVYLGVVVLGMLVFTACKKNDEVNDKTENQNLKEQNWSQEIYDAMKDIYLWNDALPTTFNKTKYSSAQDALKYLISFKINPQTSKAIDHYSFIDKIGELSGEFDTGISSGDYGLMIGATYNSAKQVSFFISYVYKNSPAGTAGIQRGYEITKINGSTNVHPDLTSNNYLDNTSQGYKNVINALFYSTSTTITLKRQDGTTLDASLKTGTYTINSVLCDSIYPGDVGYVVFNTFLDNTSRDELNNVFAKFETRGVKHIIVDLRYNKGGIVKTSEYFCNLLAPKSASGKLMYKYKFNSILTNYYATSDEPTFVNFEKTNNIEPQDIYFIVSGSTASASELLINNLRPYYYNKMFLIGATSYGKPCGFWATPIGYTEKQTTIKEGYDLYAVSFETVNSNNEGGYYTGMEPGSAKYPGVKAYDYYDCNWGDTNDNCLAQALNYIENGTFLKVQTKLKSVSSVAIKNDIDRHFVGMIDDRHHRLDRSKLQLLKAKKE